MKDKKIIGAIIAGLLLGAVLIFLFYTFVLQKPATQVENTNPVPTQTDDVPVEMSNYRSESGFTFSYPANLTIEEKDISENEFASLHITSPDKDGSITFIVSETNAKTLEQVMTQSKIDIQKAQKNTIPFADLEASEYTFFDGTIVTAVIDQGALFIMKVNPGGDQAYWQNIYNSILSSFVFELPQKAQSTAAPKNAPVESSDDIQFEGEEVVE